MFANVIPDVPVRRAKSKHIKSTHLHLYRKDLVQLIWIVFPMLRATGKYSAQISVQSKEGSHTVGYRYSHNLQGSLARCTPPTPNGATRSGSLKCSRNLYRHSTWHETTAFLVGSGFLHNAVPNSLVPLHPKLPGTCSTRMVGCEQLVRCPEY